MTTAAATGDGVGVPSTRQDQGDQPPRSDAFPDVARPAWPSARFWPMPGADGRRSTGFALSYVAVFTRARRAARWRLPAIRCHRRLGVTSHQSSSASDVCPTPAYHGGSAMPQATIADFPASWSAGATAIRSYDSGYSHRRFQLHLDQATQEKLETLM